MKTLFALFVLSVTSINCQTLSFPGGYGMSTIEKINNKQNGFSNLIGINLQWDSPFPLWTIGTGVAKKSIGYSSHNLLGNNIYSKENFLLIPFNATKHVKLNKKSELFYEFGLLISYHFSKKEEIFVNNTKMVNKMNDLGYGIGADFSLGLSTYLLNRWNFNIELRTLGLNILYKKYHDVQNQLRADNVMLQFSLSKKSKNG